MIKVLSAYTYELDNPEKAVQDILSQIDTNNLLKNTAALLFCHSKFIEMGVMETICTNLPFDVLGCTSMYFAIAAARNKSAPKGGYTQSGKIMLTITVLTSDDTEFSLGISDPLSEKNADECIDALYKKTAATQGQGGEPSLAFAFLPTMFELTMDVMTTALYNSCGEVPVFGSLALDIDTHIRSPQTIYRGAAYADRMALLLLKGPVSPHFFFLRFPAKSSLIQDAVITAVNGSELVSVNNRPAVTFLREIGLVHNNDHTDAIPLVVEDCDGANPEVVIVQGINSEGVAYCSRHLSVGSTLNIGAITADYILESARALTRNINEHKSGSGLFILSCFLRAVVLGEMAEAEVKLIQQELENFPADHLYLNSGGELCPMVKKTGGIVNQAFHYAIVACLL